MSANMKIKAMLPYFGGKRTLAPIIAEELGKHSAYFEPFCGSMAVLFAKEPSSHETANDLHVDLTNLARVLADDDLSEALYERASRTLLHESLFKDAVNVLDSEFNGLKDFDRAYAYLIASWMGRNGVSGLERKNWQLAVRYTPGGGHGGARWRNVSECIPAWHQRLRGVTITCRDAFEMIEKIDDVESVAIYCDPPYLSSSRASKSCRYEHDFNNGDHSRLAQSLRRFQHARVIVSYYKDPELSDLYAGWTFAEHMQTKNLHIQNKRGSKRVDAPEVLLINGESYAAEQAAQATLF